MVSLKRNLNHHWCHKLRFGYWNKLFPLSISLQRIFPTMFPIMVSSKFIPAKKLITLKNELKRWNTKNLGTIRLRKVGFFEHVKGLNDKVKAYLKEI